MKLPGKIAIMGGGSWAGYGPPCGKRDGPGASPPGAEGHQHMLAFIHQDKGVPVQVITKQNLKA